jgi:hypothetical protein
MMEAVDGSANNGPAAGSKRHNEFLGECSLAGGVYSIDGDADRMRQFNPGDATGEFV